MDDREAGARADRILIEPMPDFVTFALLRVIRSVARAYDIDDKELLEWVKRTGPDTS